MHGHYVFIQNVECDARLRLPNGETGKNERSGTKDKGTMITTLLLLLFGVMVLLPALLYGMAIFIRIVPLLFIIYYVYAVIL